MNKLKLFLNFARVVKNEFKESWFSLFNWLWAFWIRAKYFNTFLHWNRSSAFPHFPHMTSAHFSCLSTQWSFGYLLEHFKDIETSFLKSLILPWWNNREASVANQKPETSCNRGNSGKSCFPIAFRLLSPEIAFISVSPTRKTKKSLKKHQSSKGTLHNFFLENKKHYMQLLNLKKIPLIWTPDYFELTTGFLAFNWLPFLSHFVFYSLAGLAHLPFDKKRCTPSTC